MAIETKEVDVVVCDSCGAMEVSFDRMPDGWYSGEAAFFNGRGAPVGDVWHACRPAHIKKAVMKVTGTLTESTEE